MSKLTAEQYKKLELLKLRQELHAKLRMAFDPFDLTSRPTPAQLEIIKSDIPINYIVGSNRSGKTALGGRIVSWWFMNNHPYQKRPVKWGDDPISILVMGQDNRNINFEIIPKKIKPFIGTEGVDYKVKKDGGNISAITNLRNNNTIIFMSHSDAEQARRRGQGFTGHVVWLDEMPSISQIVTELAMRVVTTDGFMYTTFTPLVRNDEIRTIVDNANGVDSKKWVISILDNPGISEEKRNTLIEFFRKISGSEAEFRARMYGDWLASEHLVFKYNSERNKGVPDGYDPVVWPHVLVVDQAASSLAGLSVWARHPAADIWWCVKAKYLQGEAFSDMVVTVEKEVAGMNIIKRVCDCNPSAFYIEAAKQGIKYSPISDKHFNKENMIDACNDAMLKQAVWFSSGAQTLIEELTVCARHEDDPSRIIKASKYHCADTFRYFIHSKPKFEGPEKLIEADERVRHAWKQRLAKEAEAQEQAQIKRERKTQRIQKRRRRWS